MSLTEVSPVFCQRPGNSNRLINKLAGGIQSQAFTYSDFTDVKVCSFQRSWIRFLWVYDILGWCVCLMFGPPLCHSALLQHFSSQSLNCSILPKEIIILQKTLFIAIITVATTNTFKVRDTVLKTSGIVLYSIHCIHCSVYSLYTTLLLFKTAL